MSPDKHSTADVVHVQGARLPLGQGRFAHQFPAGSRIQQIVDDCLPSALRPFAAVAIGGVPVPPEYWPHIRVHGAQKATVYVVPGAQITWAKLGTLALQTFATAVVSYGISQIFAEDLDTSPITTTHGLEGGANQLRPYGAIPKVFGKMRFAPPLANAWIPYTQDGKQWLQGLLCWGEGDLDISDIRLDQTEISKFGNKISVTTEHVAAGTAPAAYPKAIRVIEIGADLNEVGSITRRLGRVGNIVRINLVFPRGLYRQRSNGSREAVSVWLNFRLDRGATRGKRLTRVLTAPPDEAPFYTSLSFTAPAGEQEVDLTIWRSTGGSTNKILSDLKVASATAALGEEPLTVAATLSVVKVQATGQLSGNLPVISGVAQAKIPSWDGKAWRATATRNPAAAFREVLVGGANARPLPANRIDSQALQEWHTWCAAQNWTYDAVIHRSSSVEEILTEIAGAGMARPTWVDGRRGIIIDRPQEARVQVFTPRNIRAFTGQRSFTDHAPHVLHLPYRDEEVDYATSELRVYRPGYNAANATRVEERRVPGITNATALRRHAAYQLAAQTYRRESYEIEVDWEHLVATRGDRVGIMHDTLSRATHAARVIAVEKKSVFTELRLDTPAPAFQPGQRYSVIVRSAEVSDALDITQATRPGWLRIASDVSVGDLVLIGITGSEVLDCLLQDIEPGADASARLRLLPYGGDSVLNPTIADYTVRRITSGNFVAALPFGGAGIPSVPLSIIPGELGREYIYTRTRTDARPAIPPHNVNTGSVPTGWTNNAIGVDGVWRHEWRSERALRSTGWQAWSIPASIAKYSGGAMPDTITVSPTANILWRIRITGGRGSWTAHWQARTSETVIGEFTGTVNSTVTITATTPTGGDRDDLGEGWTFGYTSTVTGGAVTILETKRETGTFLIVRQTASGVEWRVNITPDEESREVVERYENERDEWEDYQHEPEV